MEKNEPNQNKYDAALAKYNTQLDDTEVAAQVAKIIAEKVPETIRRRSRNSCSTALISLH